MILQWSQNNPTAGFKLQWHQNVPQFKLEWRGPNLISTEWLREQLNHTAVDPYQLIETKIAVITGPKGDPGVQGLPGFATGADASFTWSPPSAQSIWVISHPLIKFPGVTVVDSSGRLVIPEITYLSINLVQISFAYPTTGTAYLN